MHTSMHRWLSFHHVWYSVDLPSGTDAPVDHPKNAESGQKPRLYLLNVRRYRSLNPRPSLCITECKLDVCRARLCMVGALHVDPT